MVQRLGYYIYDSIMTAFTYKYDCKWQHFDSYDDIHNNTITAMKVYGGSLLVTLRNVTVL